MSTVPLVLQMLLTVLLMCCAAGVFAQVFPSKPLRFLTTGAGASTDLAARTLAQGLSDSAGWTVIVDNRGNTIVAAELAARALADGYTLLVLTEGLWRGPLLQKMPYDPANDFVPISLLTRAPNLLVVHPALPVKSVRELISLAKSKPRALNYTSGQSGSSSHLAAELFKSMTKVDIVRISYRSAAIEMSDLLSGQVHMTFGSAGSVGQYVRAKRLRPLGVSTAEPSTLFPGVPTIADSGVPGYESAAMSGVFAPAKTPPAIITRLNQEIVRVLNKPDIKEKFFNTGVETVGSSPEEFAAKIKSEMTRLTKVIRDAGIRDE